MTDSKLVDSSVWLDYFFNGKHTNIIDSKEILLLSSLSLFEINRKLIKSKQNETKIVKSMEFIKKRSIVIPLDTKVVEKAVEVSIAHNLPTIDSLIYATSLTNKAVLITLDNDFRGLKDVLLL